MIVSPNRIWVDGCFDFTHHGHAGALLQAKRTGPPGCQLICGVHNDEDITSNKGMPVMNNRERIEHTRANRWSDEIVENAPYVTEPSWMDRYGCMYVVHGDDITLDADGKDCYRVAKDLGRFRVVKRTAGVSTTEIIHRILTNENNISIASPEYFPTTELLEFYSSGKDGFTKHCYVFDETLDNCVIQSNVYKLVPSECVYIQGDFDLFHMGHIDQLRVLKSKFPDSRIILGLLLKSDNNGDTIMTFKERALSVLSCKWTDGLILNPTFKLDVSPFPHNYKLNSFELCSGSEFSSYLTTEVIINRIKDKRDHYTVRNEKKGMHV